MAFTRADLEAIRADIDAALAPVARKHNMKLTLSKITYREESFKASINAARVSADGLSADARRDWADLCKLYGFIASDYGTKFVHQGNTHTIIGMRSRSKKPIITRRDDGKEYIWEVQYVHFIQDRQAAARAAKNKEQMVLYDLAEAREREEKEKAA